MVAQVGAETTLLRLVHDALRRDADRLRLAARHGRLADPVGATGLHGGWRLLHRQLLRHHRDVAERIVPLAGIYLPARPEEGEVLRNVEQGQTWLEQLATEVDVAVGARDVAWFEVAADRFTGALTEHLGYAERTLLPLLISTLRPRDWRFLEREQRRAESPLAPAEFWPWVLDAADPRLAEPAVRALPANIRLHLTRSWQPRYTRAAYWR